jgi:16S rRNA (guanine966-N2)-methyltransferase
MRIIAGASKGKKILQPKDQLTRPLKDLTKESIFNIIVHSNKFETKIEGSKILDLFSGVGSFGLECLSRGALNAVFIESYKEVLDILKKNIENLNYVNSSTIIEQDIYDSLNFKTLKKFDIIFIDAPYKEKRVDMLLQKIFDAKILNDKSIIIIHRHKKENENFIDNFNIIEEKIYGISKVIFGNFL